MALQFMLAFYARARAQHRKAVAEGGGNGDAKRAKDARAAAARRLRAEGMTVEEIALRLHVHERRVRRYLTGR